MKLGEAARRLNIDSRKLTEYALNPEHPRGQHKARHLRESLGFTLETVDQLIAQIQALAPEGEALLRDSDEHGQRLAVDLLLKGPTGRQATVRTGWLIPHDSDEARLMTIYVRRPR